MEDLENQHTQNNDQFPKTLSNAFNLLVYWKHSYHHSSNPERGSDAVAFETKGQIDGANKMKLRPPKKETVDTEADGARTIEMKSQELPVTVTTNKQEVTCWRCSKMGTTQMNVNMPIRIPQLDFRRQVISWSM